MDEQQIVIKKYANRRLYNTDTSAYVTLEDLAAMVKEGTDFVVQDAKSGADITRSVLTQIIFEQESKGQNLLPVNFLRQLIQYYDNSMQMLVPGYLEMSMDSFARDHDKWNDVLTSAFGGQGTGLLEEQIRKNTRMFEQALRLFVPAMPDLGAMAGMPASVSDFNTWMQKMQAAMTPGMSQEKGHPENSSEAGQQTPSGADANRGQIEALQEQLAQMQRQLNTLSGKKQR